MHYYNGKKGEKPQDKGREYMKDQNTQFFQFPAEKQRSVRETLRLVIQALNEKGYQPLNQIVGYLMSGEPTYITSHLGARSAIQKLERDEIVEELLTYYIQTLTPGEERE